MPEVEASDDRTCAQRGQDTVAQLVGCVQQRLAHYRAAGELAVTFGFPVLQRKVREHLESALSMGAPPDAGLDDAPPATVPARSARSGSASGNGHAVKLAAQTSARPSRATPAPGDSTTLTLPIPGYDTLSASQVVERLAGLPPSDLDEVRAYETAHRNRRTILGKIEQLRSA